MGWNRTLWLNFDANTMFYSKVIFLFVLPSTGINQAANEPVCVKAPVVLTGSSYTSEAKDLLSPNNAHNLLYKHIVNKNIYICFFMFLTGVTCGVPLSKCCFLL